MEAVISESLFEKQKSSFDMLNRNWVFILLFSNNNNNNDGALNDGAVKLRSSSNLNNEKCGTSFDSFWSVTSMNFVIELCYWKQRIK